MGLGVFFPLALAFGTLLDVPESRYLATDIFWAVDQEIFVLQDSRFQPEKPATPAEVQRGMMVVFCSDWQDFSLSAPVTKGRLAESLYSLLEAGGFLETLPPDWRTVTFRDLEKDASFYEAAQVLVALGIFERNGGFFGTEGVRDPILTREMLVAVLVRLRNLNLCGTETEMDSDQDEIADVRDLCPFIPAHGTDRGCPLVGFRKPHAHRHETPKLFLSAPEEASFVEDTEIRAGDRFFMAVTHPSTGEIYSRSNEYEIYAP
jgi:hypothetical protein